MSNRNVRWLYDELPRLVGSGILSDDAAGRLREHYGEPPAGGGRRVALIVFSILASMLIGAGIIMLLANNWEGLSRPVRTVLALAPLVVTQALACWIVATGRDGAAWREGVSTFLCMSVAASIALIGQTYHIPGDLGSFLLTWMVLTLPLVYLFRATAPCLIYLTGITSWAGYAQSEGGQAILFWLLLAAVLPRVVMAARKNRYSAESGVMGWGLILCLCVATGITLEKVMPGLWIVV